MSDTAALLDEQLQPTVDGLAAGRALAERTCSVEGCHRPYRSRGWCATHYARWSRYGDPAGDLAVVRGIRPGAKRAFERKRANHAARAINPAYLAFRFWQQVDKTDTCWLWQGDLSHDGYGRFRLFSVDKSRRRRWQAHRFAYEAVHGPVPDGLTLDHLCRVRNCVRPAHLEAVSAAENCRRGARLITHCPQGHEYTAENTAVYNGKRQCRACSRRRFGSHPARSRRDR